MDWCTVVWMVAAVCGDMDTIEGETVWRPWFTSQAHHSLTGSPFLLCEFQVEGQPGDKPWMAQCENQCGVALLSNLSIPARSSPANSRFISSHLMPFGARSSAAVINCVLRMNIQTGIIMGYCGLSEPQCVRRRAQS